MSAESFTGHCYAWLERTKREPKYLDALIRSYLVFMWTRIPETVVKDGRRIFGVMGEQYCQCVMEVTRLMSLQR